MDDLYFYDILFPNKPPYHFHNCVSAFVAEPRPNFPSQGSDEEPQPPVANENETFNSSSATQDEPAGDNNWEVVSTSNEPATSIDGAANSSAEAFVLESNNVAAAAASGVRTNKLNDHLSINICSQN